jgi:hypothetical protein
MWNVQKTREVHTGIWWGDVKESGHFENLGLDGRIILKRVFKKWDGGRMEWIYLAQNTDRLRGSVNSVMDLRVP